MDQIEKIVQELKEDKNINAIYLFGSYATGRQKKYSDIDICLITKTQDKKENLKYYGFSSKKIDISIFDRLPLQAKYKVFKEGIILHLKDKDKIEECKRKTIEKYLEQKPFFDRQLKHLLDKKAV